jgi:hypothetical protein
MSTLLEAMMRPMTPWRAAQRSLLALGFLAAIAPSALWATDIDDPRWLPWVGCWEPRGSSHMEGSDLVLCILPEGDGVTLTTWLDGEAIEVDLLRADVGPTAITEVACEGTRSLSWSADGARVFVEGSITCDPGGTRATRGVFSITDAGSTWVEIQALGFEDGVDPILSVRTFHPASPASLERNGLEAPMAEAFMTIRQARQQAARPLTDAAILEAQRRTGGSVTAALVVELGHPFALNTDRLRALRSGGVTPEVIDVMVAVTYPERFEIRADGMVGPVAPTPVAGAPRRPVSGGAWGYGAPTYRTRYGFGYGLFWDPYLGYGYGYGVPGYGYGYSSPYRWYSGPAYIVVPPGEPSPSRGTMTPTGYRPSAPGASRPATSNSSGSEARPSAPASSPPPARATPPATQSSPPPASSTPPRRQAIPRTGGGGGDPLP